MNFDKCIPLCNYPHNNDREHCHGPHQHHSLSNRAFPWLQVTLPALCHYNRFQMLLLEWHRNENIQYVFFCFWLLSFTRTLFCVYTVCSLLLLSSLPFYGSFLSLQHTLVSIFQLMGTWVVSSSWPLWIKLLQILTYKSLCGHRLLLLSGKYLGMDLEPHVKLMLVIPAPVFRGAVPFYISTNNLWKWKIHQFLYSASLWCLFIYFY